MNWFDTIRQSPYEAGSVAARSCKWWDTISPQATAAAYGLQEGEPAYIQFCKGWYAELREYGLIELHNELNGETA